MEATTLRAIARGAAVDPWLIRITVIVSGIFVAFVSLLDASCFFEISYQLRLLFVTFYLIFMAIALRSRQVQAAAACSVIWTLGVLPGIRWNHEKAFYVDARRIEVGMTDARVREIMKPYIEIRRGMAYDGDGRVVYRPTGEEQQWEPWTERPADVMLFLHSIAGWSDSCEVQLSPNGRVRRIHIEKD